jgi:hypothetical protein
VRLFRRLNNLCRLLSREKGYDSGSAALSQFKVRNGNLVDGDPATLGVMHYPEDCGWDAKDESARKFLLPANNGSSVCGQKSVAVLRGVIGQGHCQ